MLRSTGNIRLSCHACGIERTTAFRARQRSQEFREQWARAEADACDVLEAEARKRALATSDTLLIFLLKCHNPEKYGDKLTIRVIQKVAKELDAMGTEDLLAVLGYEAAEAEA